MSTPALMMAISATLHPVTSAASGAPLPVQQAVSLGTGTAGSVSLTLATAPVAGNTLTLMLARSNTNAPIDIPGWVMVSNVFAGATVGKRAIYRRTADGTEGTTISIDSVAGNTGFSVQEWQGSVTITPAEGGQTTAASGAFSVGPFAAPTASAVPVIFGMFNGSSAMPPWIWPSGWTSVGPLANGSFPSRGQALAYGAATASALAAQTITYAGTRGDGVAVLWVGAWIS